MANRNSAGFGFVAAGTLGNTPSTQGLSEYFIDAGDSANKFNGGCVQVTAGYIVTAEDAATAEISRAQVWQWVHHDKELDTGETVTTDLVKNIIEQQIAAIEEDMGTEQFNTFPFDQAKKVFEEVALADEFVDFLTLPAYEIID